jgi:hypothetical protein
MEPATPISDSLDAEILSAIRPLLERIRAAAYDAGQRDALASLIQSAQSRLQSTHVADGLSHQRPEAPFRRSITVLRKEQRTRTPNGVIPNMVEGIVNDSPEGMRQGEIVDKAYALHNFDLKRSSLRVALDSLVKQGRISEKGGSWFPKGKTGAPNAPIVNPEPSVQAVDAAGKVGGT